MPIGGMLGNLVAKHAELLAAIAARKRGAVKQLIAAGGLGSTDEDRRTALHVVMNHGRAQQRIDDVNALLAAGADPNARDQHGQTPLYHAVSLTMLQYDRECDLVEALIGAGANPNHVDKFGMTVLDYARDMQVIQDDRHPPRYRKPFPALKPILELLVTKGAKPKFFKQAELDAWLGSKITAKAKRPVRPGRPSQSKGRRG